MEKKKILICGASGFIGRNLYEYFKKQGEFEVFGTCFNDNFTDDPNISDLDLTNKDSARTITVDVDTVIHAAAVTDGSEAVVSNPARYTVDNILMNTLLAEAAYNNKIGHFIFLSCTVVYPSSFRPLKENEASLTNLHPRYQMGARIKMFAEDLCRFYSNLGGTKFTVIRPSSVYGPYDKFHLQRGHILDATLVRVLAPGSTEIGILGKGEATRDFVYVSDLIQFVELVLTVRADYKFDVFNVGSGSSISVYDLVKMIVRISGRRLSVVHKTDKPNILTHTAINIERSKRIFGWQPKVDLETGIRQTMDWYLKNRGEKNGK